MNHTPERPVFVLTMNGTDDPFVPYDGGPIAGNLFPWFRKRRRPERGRIISAEEASQFWLKHDGIIAEPKTAKLPDLDPNDLCRAEKTEWTDAKRGATVALYKIIGGGHTYPGGRQYLPERVIGKTCRDLQATEVIWQFFSQHARACSSRAGGEQK